MVVGHFLKTVPSVAGVALDCGQGQQDWTRDQEILVHTTLPQRPGADVSDHDQDRLG